MLRVEWNLILSSFAWRSGYGARRDIITHPYLFLRVISLDFSCLTEFFSSFTRTLDLYLRLTGFYYVFFFLIISASSALYMFMSFIRR
jgi:hypothetical protein